MLDALENYRKLAREYHRLRVKVAPRTDDTWGYNDISTTDLPGQGWKLHLSASVLNAGQVLNRTRETLKRAGVLFKAARNLEILMRINSGFRYAQIGKFLTVYPRDERQALQLAKELHSCTLGMKSPNIPFDCRYRKRSIVHYRFGSFLPGNEGNQEGWIFDPRGRRRLDRRENPVPHWVTDPFNPTRRQSNGNRLLEKGYLVFRALSQRGKGGVYEALDLGGSFPDTVIIKEGRQAGEAYWDLSDGFSRTRTESTLLGILRKKGVDVPRLIGKFQCDGNYYVVMEKLGGRRLLKTSNTKVGRPSWKRSHRLYTMISGILDSIHATGWVWRDCKPDNLIWENGRLRPLDFEGACKITVTNAPPWGSQPYTPPSIYQSLCRPAGIQEDNHALGVIAYQFGVGHLPPKSKRERRRELRDSGCPRDFSTTILNLLAD